MMPRQILGIVAMRQNNVSQRQFIGRRFGEAIPMVAHYEKLMVALQKEHPPTVFLTGAPLQKLHGRRSAVTLQTNPEFQDIAQKGDIKVGSGRPRQHRMEFRLGGRIGTHMRIRHQQ